ncbi:MAG: MBOAT family O-acyltransferase [Acidimicrobiia bacterium]|nr:MBOAT family O-acyltransferase [Acidimicrobiia bacterium]
MGGTRPSSATSPCLAYFKYLIFFVDSAFSTFNALPFGDADPPFLEIVLPVGISFFTFQAISYVIDVGRNEIEPMQRPSISRCTSPSSPSWSPAPSSGPPSSAPQLATRPDPRHVRFAEAFRLIFAGLFKKVVVSSYVAAQIVDPVFDNPELESGPAVLFAIYGFAVQIYADFSGYTDIAIGCALLLGFRFPQNFDAPYTARSMQEFWRRWHMTLSRWLRDYLYIPLGGNRGPTGFVYRNLFLTMLLGGLWHGAAWTFVIWGALHGTALISERSERLWMQAPVGAATATPCWRPSAGAPAGRWPRSSVRCGASSPWPPSPASPPSSSPSTAPTRWAGWPGSSAGSSRSRWCVWRGSSSGPPRSATRSPCCTACSSGRRVTRR